MSCRGVALVRWPVRATSTARGPPVPTRPPSWLRCGAHTRIIGTLTRIIGTLTRIIGTLIMLIRTLTMIIGTLTRIIK